MPKLTVKLGLILYGAGLAILMLLNQFSPISSAAPDGFGYRLTDNFKQTLLNNRVLVASSFRLVPGESPAILRNRIRQTFKPNQNPYVVPHGHSSSVPEGWIYTELANPTATAKEVVLSLPQYRCGGATLFLTQARPNAARLDSVASFRNNTPLAERFFLTYQYAFPVVVPPGQTTGVLLRTNTYTGYHEFPLELSRRSAFAGQLLSNTVRELLYIFSYLFIGLVSLLVGFITPSQLMRTYGLVMFAVMLQTCFFFGYLSTLPYPGFISINSDTISTYTRLLMDTTAQLFLYESFKLDFGESRLHKWATRSIVGVCVMCVLLHLLPPQFYSYLNVPINRIMNIMTLVSLIWACYFSFLAYRRARIAPVGLFLLVFIADMVIRQGIEFLLTHNVWLLKYPAPGQNNPLLLVSLLTYLTVMQFRRELVSKRQMKKQIRQAQDDADALRREEVERIGRDLHDQVGNTLAAAMGYLSRPQADTSTKSLHLIRTAISELRFLSHNLIKDNNSPLTEKVQMLLGRFNDFSDIEFLFKDHAGNRADQLTAIQQQSIYHILQELFTNIVRHSGASRVYVQFFGDDQTLEVSVEDNGVGFDLTTAREKGVGLQNMYKRAELAQIILQFDPAPSGTSVHLTIHHDETLPNGFN